jgi:hypothetical protein
MALQQQEETMGRKQERQLCSIILRNFKYQTPTPVVEEGRVTRYNVTIFASDYRRMMGIATSTGGFTMPRDDREALIKQFSEKAKTAGGDYDLSTWSMGELAAAHEDVSDIDELKKFDKAIRSEIEKRTISKAV